MMGFPRSRLGKIVLIISFAIVSVLLFFTVLGHVAATAMLG